MRLSTLVGFIIGMVLGSISFFSAGWIWDNGPNWLMGIAGIFYLSGFLLNLFLMAFFSFSHCGQIGNFGSSGEPGRIICDIFTPFFFLLFYGVLAAIGVLIWDRFRKGRKLT